MEDVLLIDDLREFRQVGVPTRVARTSADGLRELQAALESGHRWEQVWLDHDLGEATGELDDITPVVEWLCERAHDGRRPPIATVVVHTSNPVGARRMMATLSAAGYRVLRLPAESYLRAAAAG